MLKVYLIALNLVTFFVYALDKSLARRKKRRVPERVLLGLAAIGGSLGALMGMALCHHKTKKPKFVFSVPLLLAAHAAILWLALR